MTELILLTPILLPLAAAILVLVLRKSPRAGATVTILAAIANLALAAMLFQRVLTEKNLTCSLPWVGMGMDFSLRLYHFSGVILLAAAFFGTLISLYCWKSLQGKGYAGSFLAYLLITLAMVSGAVLADNLVALLFFWEGLLLTMFGMIYVGSQGAWRTAVKAFVIVGITDLCMMVGMALAGWQAGTLSMSQIAASPIPLSALGATAMVLMLIGAMGKSGAMPFHSWIPDAAVDAPLPFMALLPGAIEKLVGIYMLARISMDLFAFSPQSWVSMFLMIVGAITILLAVMMALIQKDYKRLLSYHAISQVGYMILGIGTALPVGIVGGLFHMINNALYKSCLFLTGGAVEKQAGTTDLNKLGGLARKMPLTFACFAVAAVSISGVPPFNGFFSKELVYDAAKERNLVFYLAAVVGSFFTAASFLKLGHAAYLGKRDAANDAVREAPPTMLLPMVVLAAACVLFGLYNAFPINFLFAPVLGEHVAGEHHMAGWPTDMTLVIVTCAVLAAAIINHLIGARVGGGGLHASDHIHHAPILAGVYDKAARRRFDPYDIGRMLLRIAAAVLWAADRIIDWIYDRLTVGITYTFAFCVRLAHTGNYATYVVWCLLGSAIVIVFLVRSV